MKKSLILLMLGVLVAGVLFGWGRYTRSGLEPVNGGNTAENSGQLSQNEPTPELAGGSVDKTEANRPVSGAVPARSGQVDPVSVAKDRPVAADAAAIAEPLWQPDPAADGSLDGDMPEPTFHVSVDQDVLAKLQVGQVLEFFIPQLGQAFASEVSETSNQLDGVKVWKGAIRGEEAANGNFILTQGKTMTNVALTTSSGVFNVHIDNKTGEGVVIDDREYSTRQSDSNDAVPLGKGPVQ